MKNEGTFLLHWKMARGKWKLFTPLRRCPAVSLWENGGAGWRSGRVVDTGSHQAVRYGGGLGYSTSARADEPNTQRQCRRSGSSGAPKYAANCDTATRHTARSGCHMVSSPSTLSSPRRFPGKRTLPVRPRAQFGAYARPGWPGELRLQSELRCAGARTRQAGRSG